MLKLALQESLRTAELDKMRNLERWVHFYSVQMKIRGYSNSKYLLSSEAA